ncbi:MAG: hypothetical protein IJI47_02225 [Eubacterium sp.]|nr:hypothetical protein [Eubacterium sp.]
MNITVNQKSIAYILDEQRCNNDIRYYLNKIIDFEIEKENPDTDLLDNCTELLFEIETGSVSSFESAEAMLKICKKSVVKNSRTKRQIAAVILIVLVASGALLQTNPAIAEQTRDMFSHIASVLGIAADDTDTGKSEIVSIYAELGENINLTVKSEDEINTDNTSIIAVDEHDFERAVPMSECKVSKEQIDSTHIMVTYSYEGCACSIVYTLEV